MMNFGRLHGCRLFCRGIASGFLQPGAAQPHPDDGRDRCDFPLKRLFFPIKRLISPLQHLISPLKRLISRFKRLYFARGDDHHRRDR